MGVGSEPRGTLLSEVLSQQLVQDPRDQEMKVGIGGLEGLQQVHSPQEEAARSTACVRVCVCVCIHVRR